MRALLLVLAFAVSNCAPLRVPALPVAPAAAAPSSAALPARELVFAVNSLAPSIEAAVTAGTLPRAAAIAQLEALRRLVDQVDRLADDLRRWSDAQDPARRAELKAEIVTHLHAMGAILVDDRPNWTPVVDAYVRTVLAIGGAQ